MNAVQSNNVTPKNLMVNVVCSSKSDPLGIDLNAEAPSKWELDQLTALISVRILALGNRVEGMLRQELPKEALKLVTDMQSLAIVIRDLQIWPLINGQQLNFKYGGALYTVEAVSPRKFEEIERAKDHYLKSAQIKKDS